MKGIRITLEDGTAFGDDRSPAPLSTEYPSDPHILRTAALIAYATMLKKWGAATSRYRLAQGI